jgi:hypothetical protein
MGTSDTESRRSDDQNGSPLAIPTCPRGSPVMTLRALRRPLIGFGGRTRRGRLLAVASSIGVLVLSAAVGLQISLALFTSSGAPGAILGTKAIFPGERVTPAFIVGDASGGGAPIDRSSQLGFSADGRTFTSSAWSTSFASSRYLDFDLNASLPGFLAVTSAAFELDFSSAAAGSTACYYFEVRRISTGAVLGAFGSSGAPSACVTGTALTLSTTSVASSVISTDTLNDLRIRVLGTDSGSNGMVLDRATVSGATAFASFTLYPVRFSDAADTTATVAPWELAGP